MRPAPKNIRTGIAGGCDHADHVSPYAALEKLASSQPHADAIVLDETRISYEEFFRRVAGCVTWLKVNDVIPGEVIAVCIRDEITHLICAMALLCLGSPQISLGSHETDATKRRLAQKVGVTKLIVEEVKDWMAGMKAVIVRGEEIASTRTIPREILSAHPVSAVAVYSSTSGTTSIPKTFRINYGRLNVNTDRYIADPKERRSLRLGSIEFDANRLNRICSILAGNTCILLREGGLDHLISACERASVSVLRVGPHRLERLMRSSTPRRMPSATHILASGGRVSGALRSQVQKHLTDKLWVQYSTSETGLVSTAAPHQHELFPEGIGFPEPGITVEIFGSENNRISPGEVGEVRIQKHTMASGYIDEPGAGRKFQQGWFYPGDLVSRPKDGPLIFHGRCDDVMIMNGINIFPSAIEDALEALSSVREAVAFPVVSRTYGEIPVAAVVLSEEAENEDISTLLSYCQQLLGIRAPRQIRIVSKIPRNAFGKPLRRELANL
jgi:acyl-coenzyme A synthetase/AMP-(fatty) acid ligase